VKIGKSPKFLDLISAIIAEEQRTLMI